MENHMKPYTEDFYAARRKDNIRSSARVIVPLVLELVEPRSVIDVGCGTGEWLSVFEELGVEDVWGVDGFCRVPGEQTLPLGNVEPGEEKRRHEDRHRST